MSNLIAREDGRQSVDLVVRTDRANAEPDAQARGGERGKTAFTFYTH